MEMELMKFDDKKVVGIAKVEMNLTEEDINIIICNALEGGISYWGRIDSKHPDWNKPKENYYSDWATKLLIDGKSFDIIDTEEEGERYTLTLEKLIKGFTKNYKERTSDNDIHNGDATTADCIVQYALFGELVYG